MSNNTARSAEKIAGNVDLLTKILLLLPARPLFRFKLVSKWWMFLIYDPCFSSLWKPESFLSALILRSPYFYGPCYIPEETMSKTFARFLDFIEGNLLDDCEV
ncbi:hypothetical protein FXO38_04542 [Capsicum annuum]|nr:hypothetical protein FXO37_24573 [Capsicum annuum]KAF3675912.1 hypothetical protein FXO38_04542 [Capsicum annuum]